MRAAAAPRVADIHPLTPVQEGILFHSLAAPEPGLYVERVRCLLEGPLDVAAFKEAWRRIVDRHPALRSWFVWDRPGRPLQIVAGGVELPWREVDLTGVPRPAGRERADALLDEENRRGLAPDRPPLFRLVLATLGPERRLFAWIFHHLLLDGWSSSLVLDEVTETYAAIRGGREAALPPARPFRDYVAWLRGRDASEAGSFWRGLMRGFAAPTPLPFAPAGGPPPGPAPPDGEIPVPLSAAESAALLEAARRHRVTPSTLLLGAWSLLLARHGGARDVVCGVTFSGRPADLAGVASMVGLFINTLPVRVDVHPRARVTGWLRGLQDLTSRIDAFQHLPLAEIHGLSSVPRGAPLFESLVVVENYPGSPDGGAALGTSGLRVTPIAEIGGGHYPLTLIAETGRALTVGIAHAHRRVAPAAAARIGSHLRSLLLGLAQAEDRPLGDVPMMDTGEREFVVHGCNRTRARYPEGSCVHEVFAEVAAACPEASALSGADGTFTYRELDRWSDAVARRLEASGLGPEARAGILLPRSAGAVAAILGVLKAGGAYVPLDPSHPRDRLARILEDSGARALVTRGGIDAGWVPGSVPVLDLERIPRDGGRAAARPARAFPDGLAYVMYTSGSTGRPKGVLVTHRNVTRLVRGAGYADLGPGETILMFAPLSFDASTFEIWGALLNGGRLAVAPPGALAPRELAAFAAREGVTTLWMTAPLFHATADGPIAALAGLRQLLAGGDVLAPGSVRKAAAALPGCRIVNGYGPTEATTFTCAYAVPADGPPPGNVPIGAPIGNARVVILDDRMEPVPVGVPGQIYIGGDGLARGYLGSPDLTASRFVPDPLSGDPGARLYASGDRGRRLPDGTIEFLGRIDRQVKVRGFRIEPAEIEAALRGHPDVSEALVVLRGDLPGGGGLAAYVVSRGTAPAAQDLRRFLEARLPSHMIPAAFAAIDAVPLTPSGKVDRASLPAPAPAPDGPGAPPGTPLEATIAFVWREILRLPAVDRDDGFFDLGGHSLLAMQVVARLRDALGVDLTLARFFEAPTVAGLAAAVEEARGAVSGPAPPPVARSARGGPVPLSSAQRRLWVLHQVEPASAFYNVHAAARLEGRLDVEALRRALTELVRRHEALRTTFATVDGDPVQVVADPAPVRLEVADLTALPAASREARALAAASAEARRPFDLETGPLLRASLQRLGAEDHVLAITIHHLAADGWSLGIVFRELRTLYAAFAAGRPSPLPEPELQYRDYALWQRAWLSGEILGAQIAYWRDRLAGAPDLLALPADRPRPKHLSFRGGSRRFTVPGPLAARLEELGRREGATLFMTLLAAFKVWISRHAGEEDVVVGAPVAGRGRPELDGIVGFFANTLALRTDLSGNPPFGEVLRRVRGTALQAYARQDAPFEQVVEALRVRRDPGRAPVFQVMFDLQNAPGADLDLPGLGALPIDVETGTAKFDLHVSVAPEGGALAGLVEYAADLFDPETIDRMLGRFLTLLESASADPATPILDLPMIPDGELRRIRSAERGAAAPDPAGTPVHLLFEARAARSPEAIAVDGEDGRLTYRELDARSSGLARELRRLGVGPDVAAGIFMERSPEMVVAILGVLKAGGAYLPLDPSYPEERIAFMRRDAACPVILAGRGTVEGIRPDGAAVVEVDAFREAPGSGEAGPAGRPAGPESLAYVLYTSGSTGRPKGVMVPHRALANHMGWMLGTFPMTAEDRVLQRTPAVFDASVWEFFAPLLSGARLVLAPSGAHHDTSRLARALASERITTLQLVPSLLALLLEEIGLEACRDLRLVFCGGEPLAPELRDRFVARLGIPLHNLYGPTEACIDATWWSCLPGDGGRTVPVGRPIAGMRALVLDGRLRPSPIGVIGELHLGGEGLARGYLGRPDLTAGSFLPDPRGPRPGSRLYATGDRARRLPDGTIELLGRRDDQVKLRGVRIEPAEVEAVLAEHPEVREAAVVVREDEPGRPYLAAYVAPRDGRTPTPATLRAALRDRLPGAMVPSTFVALPALPRTPGGKVDRRSLPAPERRAGGAGEPPLTPVEEAIGRIWSGVLGRGAFGPGDDFFEAGGHSLLAVQVRHRIREVFQVEVPFRVFFEATTLRELARAVAAAGRSPEEAEAIARIFLRVESLSPEEVRGALEEPAAAGGGG